MRNTTMRERLLASTLFCTVLATTAISTTAMAAEPGADTAVDEVVVTGSRIARTDLTAPTPLTIVNSDMLQQQGHNNIVDVLTAMPQFAASFGTARTQSTFSGAASSGLNLINLRNLGGSRSLTLINGRRVPAGNVTTTAVDFNMIPSANIDRVEVITGGASAVYGADAVAGVINIITKRNFEGLEFGASYGAAIEHKDNINPSGYLMIGAAFGEGDKGHATLTAQYDYQGLVRCADRYLCAEDFAWSYPNDPIRGPNAYSGVAPQGRFFIQGPNSGFNGNFTQRNGSFQQTPTVGNPNGVIPFSVPVDGYNRNGNRTLAIPTKRLTLASEIHYELLPNVEAFLEMNYGSSKTTAPFEGHPFQSSSDLVGGVLEASIPGNNPFIPANLRAQYLASGDTDGLTWSQRFDQFGLRGATNTREMVRVSGGLTGSLDTLFGFGKDWKWEASYTYGRTTLDSISNGLVSTLNLYNGLRVEADPANPGKYRCTDPAARGQGCVPINPFAPYTDDMKKYLTVNAGQHGEHELEQGLAYMSGSIAELPAGPLQVAVGVESRRTTAYLDYDDVINRGTVTGNRIQDSEPNTFRTNEAYLETIVPILRDMTLAHSLNFEGAYRWSNGSTVGDYQTWKYGGSWEPIAGLRFRVMKAKSVRAPNESEVAGSGQTFGVVNDPCTAARRNANATRAANCLADGVPANYSPVLQVEQSVAGVVGGNPNLKPEEAETLTYGVVFQAGQIDGMPDFLQSLTVSVDRFEIDLQGAINTVGRQLSANACYDTAGAGRALFCSQITRGTNPLVPGANYVLVGVNDQLQNIASFDIRGVDVQVGYQVVLNDWFKSAPDLGRLNFNLLATFYDKAKEVPLAGQEPIDLLGFAGGSTSDQGFLKRQATLSTTWAYKGFRANWNVRYIGEAEMSPFTTGPKVPSYTYHDIQFRYDLNRSVEFYGGMNNVADKEPPFFVLGASGTQALDTIPAYYDVFGRQIYAGFKLKFQ